MQQMEQAKAVLEMLERLSADSPYAHRASGLRGSLLRSLERIGNEPEIGPDSNLAQLLERAVEILEAAAAELRGLE